MKRFFVFLMISILFFSCSNFENERVMKLANKDLDAKLLLIEEILLSHGMEDFSVYGTAHFQYTSNEISKQHIQESFSGTALIPEGPPGVEIPPSYQEIMDSQSISSYERSDLVVNYDNEIRNQVYFERFSFIIVAANLESQGIAIIEESVGNFVLSNTRGDTLTVLTR